MSDISIEAIDIQQPNVRLDQALTLVDQDLIHDGDAEYASTPEAREAYATLILPSLSGMYGAFQSGSHDLVGVLTVSYDQDTAFVPEVVVAKAWRQNGSGVGSRLMRYVAERQSSVALKR